MSKTGWKTQDIMQLDYYALLDFDVVQLRKMTQRISDYANKRISALEKADLSMFSAAYGVLELGKKKKRKGRFGVRGIADLDSKQQRMAYIREIQRAQSFIEDKTSKVEETRKVKAQFEERFGRISSTSYDRLWKVYDEIRDRGFYQNVTSYVAIPLLKQVVSRGGKYDFDKRVEAAENALRKANEEEEYLRNTRTKDVFDYGSNR